MSSLTSCLLGRMCTTFLVNGTLSNGKVFGPITSGVFPHDRHSPRRDTAVQACRFSCFFCAAYGLLLPRTRALRSNSASRAIAMLEKSAKISPNARTVVSLSGECWSCRKLLYFPVFCGILSVAFKSNVHEVRDCRRLMLTSFFSESL